MRKEQEDKPIIEDPNTFVFLNEIKINLGQKVAVLEHSRCSSLTGVVRELDVQTQSFIVRCEKCGTDVIFDIRG